MKISGAHKAMKRVLIFLVTLGIIVPILFTAGQMGLFSPEPTVEIEAGITSESAPVLRIATDYDFCPNSYYNKDGELSGLYVEIMIEVANRLGMRPEFKTADWMGCRKMLTEDEVDVLTGLEIFSNMEGTLRTIPFCSDELRVYGRSRIDSAAALAGKKVALMARSVIATTYDLQCDYLEYSTNTEILEAVEQGEADFGICHGAVATKIIEKNDPKSELISTTTGMELYKNALTTKKQWRIVRGLIAMVALTFFALNESIVLIEKRDEEQGTVGIKLALGASRKEMRIEALLETFWITGIAVLLVIVTMNPLARMLQLDNVIVVDGVIIAEMITISLLTCGILARCSIKKIKLYPIALMLKMKETE